MNRTPVSRGGGPLSLLTALDAVTTERCAHEGACRRIGAGRRFATIDDCQRAFALVARRQMNTGVCESGFVEPDTLTECLEEIRASGCIADVENVCDAPKMCSP